MLKIEQILSFWLNKPTRERGKVGKVGKVTTYTYFTYFTVTVYGQ